MYKYFVIFFDITDAGFQSDLAAKMAVNSSKPVQSQANSSAAQLSSVFKQFDVVATSYHFYAGFIDLHICDDSNTDVSKLINFRVFASKSDGSDCLRINLTFFLQLIIAVIFFLKQNIHRTGTSTLELCKFH